MNIDTKLRILSQIERYFNSNSNRNINGYRVRNHYYMLLMSPTNREFSKLLKKFKIIC